MYDKATTKKLSFSKKFKKWFLNDEINLVYTMGKVGSSTVVNSMRNIDISVIQAHYLTFNRRGSYFVLPERGFLGSIRDFYKTLTVKLKNKIWLKATKNKKIRVITLVREPVARNISAFFEQKHYITDKELNVKELTELFWKYANHQAPLIWFDKEIKNLFGIDVYNYKLTDEKFIKIEDRNIELLVLRLEDLNESRKIISDFLGRKDFEIVRANISERKEYADKYTKFKNEIEIPNDYLNKMYNTKYMRHFYTKEEINKFREKYK